MSRYNRVKPSYWVLSKDWDERTRLLGLYVQTCEHSTTEGLYRLPFAYVAGDLGWTTAVAERQMAQLGRSGFVKYDSHAEVVLQIDALEVQPPTTERQIKGALARIRMVPATPLLWEFAQLATVHSNGLAEAIRMEMPNAFERPVTQGRNGHSNSLALTQALSSSSTASRDERG